MDESTSPRLSEVGTPGARQRILTAAYELFSQRGVRAVGVEEILARSGVAKSTLYKHFPSKDALVLAFLARREQVWTREFVQDGASCRGSTPEQRLLAIFDVFNDWFHDREHFEGCSFINTLVEMGAEHPLGRAAIDYLANIRSVVIRDLAVQAGLRAPEEFTHSWHILMKGSIIAASEGDTQAAKRAQAMARRLIADHRNGDQFPDAVPASGQNRAARGPLSQEEADCADP